MSLLLHILITVVFAVLKLVCLLVAIAYFTLAERKIMAAVQRRVGPNVVGLLGLLQPLADGLKLAGKEAVIPSQASGRIFMSAAMAVLLFALVGWSAIPFGLFDYSETMRTTSVVELLALTDWCALIQGESLDEMYRGIHVWQIKTYGDHPAVPNLKSPYRTIFDMLPEDFVDRAT